MKLIDSIFIYNEIDMLNLRLKMVGEALDHIIIIESGKNSRGAKKPFFFEIHRAKFKKWEDKIVYLKITDIELSSSKLEALRYDKIQVGLRTLILDGKISIEDCCLIGEVDEIPDCLGLITYKEVQAPLFKEPVAFTMVYHAYYLNLIADIRWTGTVAAPIYRVLKDGEPIILRAEKDLFPVNEGGSCFDYMFNRALLYDKLSNHLKLDMPRYQDFQDKLAANARPGGNIVFWDSVARERVILSKLKEEYLPTYIQENMGKYKFWIYD